MFSVMSVCARGHVSEHQGESEGEAQEREREKKRVIGPSAVEKKKGELSDVFRGKTQQVARAWICKLIDAMCWRQAGEGKWAVPVH